MEQPPKERAARDDVQALLAHAGWMRSLAFSLLGNSAAADDVVQDASVALLRSPPAQDVALEAWLSRVVRNFAWRWRRGEARRADHESRATNSTQQPSPAETIEQLELQRVLLDAVRGLDEPFRTTVVQHYFEGRTSAAIAQSLGLPAGTVRWRLKRGVDQLRERLDARWGSREHWSILLAPFAARDGGALANTATSASAQASSTAAQILQGALAMSTSKISQTAAAFAIAAGAVWWSLGSGGNSKATNAASAALAEPDRQVTAPIGASTDKPLNLSTAVDRDSQRVAALAPLPTPQAEPPAPDSAELICSVDARFIDENGAAWSDVHFAGRSVSWLSDWKPGAGVVSGADGRVRLELKLPNAHVNDRQRGELKLDLVASRAGCACVSRSATLRAGQTAHLGDVVLSPGVRIDGRVIDPNGVGIVGATVGVAPADLTDDEGPYAKARE